MKRAGISVACLTEGPGAPPGPSVCAARQGADLQDKRWPGDCLAYLGEEKPEIFPSGVFPPSGLLYLNAHSVCGLRGRVAHGGIDLCVIIGDWWGKVRVIAGEAKGHRLRSLRGKALRPTSQRTRAALFSMLGEQVRRGPFLDLFAGMGSVGIEALSRGAPWVDFVEKHEPACRLLRENLAALGFADRARVVRGRVEEFLRQDPGKRYAVVFLDPPYARGIVSATLRSLAGWVGLAAETVVVVQHSRWEEPFAPPGWRLLKRRGYGETQLAFYCPAEEGGA